MNEKIICPSAATLEQTEQEKAAAMASATISCINSTTTDTGRQAGFIEGLLQRGERNAIRTNDLVTLAGLRNPRELRAQIERERAQGALILSSVRHGGGYFLPSVNAEEARAEISSFIATVHARAVHSQRTLRAARKALRECSAQMELEGVQ